MSDAAAPTMTTAIEPDGAPRVAGLDILRGIAILGILFMNINDMGGSLWVMFAGEESRYGWTVVDQIAWFLREVLANGTARCMLEMLFGVGMVILTDRAASGIERSAKAGRMRRVARWLFGPWAVLKAYYWRNIVLFLFGLVHVFILLWPGDILHTYGLAALVAFLFRRLGPKTLLFIGLLLAIVQLIGGGYFGYYRPLQQTAEAKRVEAKQAAGQSITAAERKALVDAATAKTEREKSRADGKARIEAEDKARSPATGTFQTWAAKQWDAFLTMQSWGLEILFVWEAASTMLIGAALFKWGVIQGRRSRGFYAAALILCYGFGLGIRAIGGMNEINAVHGPTIVGPLYEFSRLATTVGHISLVHLLLGTAFGTRLLKPFEPVGRTALSVYIAQTLICLWVLYPPFMLGLYGQHSWAVWMVTAFVINAGLLTGANIWVRHYRIAPVEWAWRSIISGKLLPMRKGGGSVSGTAPLPA